MTKERPDFTPRSLAHSEIVTGPVDTSPLVSDGSLPTINATFNRSVLLKIEQLKQRGHGLSPVYPALSRVHPALVDTANTSSLDAPLDAIIATSDEFFTKKVRQLKEEVTPQLIQFAGMSHAVNSILRANIIASADFYDNLRMVENGVGLVLSTIQDAIWKEKGSWQKIIGYSTMDGIGSYGADLTNCTFTGEIGGCGIHSGSKNSAFLTDSSEPAYLLVGGRENFIHYGGTALEPFRLYEGSYQGGNDCFIALSGRPEDGIDYSTENWIEEAQQELQSENYAGSVLLRNELIFDRGMVVEP